MRSTSVNDQRIQKRIGEFLFLLLAIVHFLISNVQFLCLSYYTAYIVE
jgi:hypothetical protein